MSELSKLTCIATFDNCIVYLNNGLIERKEYLNKLSAYRDKDIIKVVTGLRRSGKSTLLEMFKEKLFVSEIKSGQIQFYNFELPEDFLNKSWDTIQLSKKALHNDIKFMTNEHLLMLSSF